MSTATERQEEINLSYRPGHISLYSVLRPSCALTGSFQAVKHCLIKSKCVVAYWVILSDVSSLIGRERVLCSEVKVVQCLAFSLK